MNRERAASESEPFSPVELVFVGALGPEGACDPAKLEVLCAERPELADGLRALAARHARGRRLVQDLADPVEAPVTALRFSERYEVQGEIARGGMGLVLEVWDAKLRRKLAMKTIRGGGNADHPLQIAQLERRRGRLVNEAQVLAQLEHPGIVPVHDVGVDEHGEVYFTMLLVRGKSLVQAFADVREHRDGWSLTRALGVLLRVGEAVAYAHQKGVLHRDLKPSNVMVGAFGETYVMDWGLARAGALERDALSEVPLVSTDRSDERASDGSSPLLTQEGELVGTPAYVSPEQAHGRNAEVDARTDIYSLGAMLYELLTGAAPYAHELRESPAGEVLAAARRSAPLALERAAPRAPAELAAICAKAMARERAERYASMADLTADLRAYLEGRVVRAHRTGALIELRKWVGRNKGAALAIAAVILGLAATATVETLLKRDLAQAQRETAARAEELRQQNYFNGVALVAAALAEGKSGRMRTLLDLCPEDLRGWEWRFLDARVDTSALRVQATPDRARAVLFTPDGSGLVTLGGGALELFDATSGARVRGIGDVPVFPIAGLTLSADGSRLFVAHAAQRLFGWDTSSWERLPDLVFGVPDSWPGAKCSPTDTLVAVFGDGPIEVFGLADKKLVARLDAGQDHVAVDWSADGARLFAGAWDGSVAAFDLRKRESTQIAREHGDRVTAIAASPDGRWLATDGWDRRVFVWDARTLEVVHRTEAMNVGPLAWSPDASVLAVGVATSVVLISSKDWHELCRLNGNDDITSSIAFDAAGERLAAASYDGDVRVFDLAAHWPSVGVTRAEAQAPQFSADGRWLAVPWWKERLVEVWSVPERRMVHGLRFDEPPALTCLSPDGARLACLQGGAKLVVIDVATGQRLAEFGGLSGQHPAYNEAFLRFSPDGARLSLVGVDGSLSVHDAETLERVWSVRAFSGSYIWPFRMSGGAWSPDGRHIVTLPNDGRVQVWSAADGTLVREWHGRGTSSQRARFSLDGKRLFLSSATGRGLECWDTATAECVWELPREFANALALDREGRRLFCVRPGAVEVRDPASGALIVSLELDPLLDHGFAVSPVNDLLITASASGLRFWGTGR